MATITDYTSGPVLQSELSHYKITEWSYEGNIIAETELQGNDCGTYTLKADITSREVVVGYVAKENADAEICGNLLSNSETKLDFSANKRSFWGTLKSDIHYRLAELMM